MKRKEKRMKTRENGREAKKRRNKQEKTEAKRKRKERKRREKEEAQQEEESKKTEKRTSKKKKEREISMKHRLCSNTVLVYHMISVYYLRVVYSKDHERIHQYLEKKIKKTSSFFSFSSYSTISKSSSFLRCFLFFCLEIFFMSFSSSSIFFPSPFFLSSFYFFIHFISFFSFWCFLFPFFSLLSIYQYRQSRLHWLQIQTHNTRKSLSESEQKKKILVKKTRKKGEKRKK